jgi:AcrR family transcriptional regulator
MASPLSLAAQTGTRARVELDSGEPSRFDRRMAKILAHAIDVFHEKGYEGASMRDLSRSSGMSLAGLYYYFESKEKLLYLIQKQTFTTIAAQLQTRLMDVNDPEQRVRGLILNHLEYFLAHPKAMKVLSHEDDVLKNGYGNEIRALKRRYYEISAAVLDEYKRKSGLDFQTRVALLSLFGMMNWIYTWYNPRVDGNSFTLATQMADTFLLGINSSRRRAAKKKAN